ncbi:vitamin B12 dependent methionine synthase [Desulfosporosinus orientis DSM 765]|uniref:Vitamin B12 dependent methionine synthase n=1 Tax=Desulfosporosinus orientis (strain ATCC 19365 / DSM 765 / NCIMB 8382 / VKM B-1628 / Singapore I) TaxID=768706 RepID=G7WGN8_DESOD|nr:vitamin B12 dependent methionine synthase [Desulfosporosinus orientis]AET68474.1 vitamin B12 dependent methionine synthase [Desulfosporosinus orientis DSM 765]
MREPVIWEIPLPEITLNEVFQAEGADYSRRPPQPRTVKLHQRMIDEAAGLVRPTAIWVEVDVTGTGVGELFLEDGYKFSSSLLPKAAGTADKMLLIAITIGTAIEDRITEYKEAGKISETFTLDACATVYVAKAGMTAMNRLEETYHREGLKTTFPMGPGHSYWQGLDDMQVIFHFLKAEQIGLHLNDSNLIIPRKSVAMVMGAGTDLPDFQGKTHCDFCSLQTTCPLSKASCRIDSQNLREL